MRAVRGTAAPARLRKSCGPIARTECVVARAVRFPALHANYLPAWLFFSFFLCFFFFLSFACVGTGLHANWVVTGLDALLFERRCLHVIFAYSSHFLHSFLSFFFFFFLFSLSCIIFYLYLFLVYYMIGISFLFSFILLFFSLFFFSFFSFHAL